MEWRGLENYPGGQFPVRQDMAIKREGKEY
jgi:hypothetical protein